MRGLLDRLRDAKDINFSAWVRRQARAALEREFAGAEPIESLDSETTPGATIGVTGSKGDSSNTTILEVAGRTETSILVRTSSRPSR